MAVDKTKTTSGNSKTAEAVDMSPEAITKRLETVEALRELCVALGRAKKADKE